MKEDTNAWGKWKTLWSQVVISGKFQNTALEVMKKPLLLWWRRRENLTYNLEMPTKLILLDRGMWSQKGGSLFGAVLKCEDEVK